MIGPKQRMLFILSEVDAVVGAPHANPAVSKAVRGSDLRHLIDPHSYKTLCVSRSTFRHLEPAALAGFDLIANLITEPVENRSTLESLRKLLRKSSARVINPPEAVLGSTREKIAERLSGIDNLIAPKTLLLQGGKRAAAERTLRGAGIQAPLILRRSGTHRGKSLQLCDSIDSALRELENPGEYIATQFIDFRSADGLYRKYRVFFIGRRRILRHMLLAESWNVHGHVRFDFMADRPDLIAHERALFEREERFAPQVQSVLDQVRSRMPLDFFGMDFGLTPDGQVLLFEANATMSFTPNLFVPKFEYLAPCFGQAQAGFRELLGLPPKAEQTTVSDRSAVRATP
jgi:glutathione synthase/RimK-type ligase-like ATP-grasp enzyme